MPSPSSGPPLGGSGPVSGPPLGGSGPVSGPPSGPEPPPGFRPAVPYDPGQSYEQGQPYDQGTRYEPRSPHYQPGHHSYESTGYESSPGYESSSGYEPPASHGSGYEPAGYEPRRTDADRSDDLGRPETERPDPQHSAAGGPDEASGEAGPRAETGAEPVRFGARRAQDRRAPDRRGSDRRSSDREAGGARILRSVPDPDDEQAIRWAGDAADPAARADDGEPRQDRNAQDWAPRWASPWASGSAESEPPRRDDWRSRWASRNRTESTASGQHSEEGRPSAQQETPPSRHGQQAQPTGEQSYPSGYSDERSQRPYGYPTAAENPLTATRPSAPVGEALPQRVPAEPDVPTVPEPPAVEPSAETPELARIATHLRREDPSPEIKDRPEGFDVNAILAAVRGVEGVRDASLRRTPAGAHNLRLELADGADPAEVSRLVARLLQERMGLAAAPQNLPGSSSTSSAPATADSGSSDEQTEIPPEIPRRRRRTIPRGRTPGAEEQHATQQAGHQATQQAGQHATQQAGAAVPSGLMGPGATTPTTAGTSYSGAQLTTTESAPSRPINPGGPPGPRVVIDHVQVSTFGLDATVEVRLAAGEQQATGLASGPAVDGYVLRLCAVAAAAAIDELLRSSTRSPARGRCFVEHAAVVPFGSCEVATVVVLLVCDGWVEQLAGSALVSGDPRQAVVRAALAAVNRRLEALLA